MPEWINKHPWLAVPLGLLLLVASVWALFSKEPLVPSIVSMLGPESTEPWLSLSLGIIGLLLLATVWVPRLRQRFSATSSETLPPVTQPTPWSPAAPVPAQLTFIKNDAETQFSNKLVFDTSRDGQFYWISGEVVFRIYNQSDHPITLEPPTAYLSNGQQQVDTDRNPGFQYAHLDELVTEEAPVVSRVHDRTELLGFRCTFVIPKSDAPEGLGGYRLVLELRGIAMEPHVVTLDIDWQKVGANGEWVTDVIKSVEQ